MPNPIAYGPAELIDQYNNFGSGHFFSKDTMRFFNSRVNPEYNRLSDEVAAFITTEQGPAPGSERLATVRIARLVSYVRDSDQRPCQKIVIDTLREFNKLSLYEAKKILRNLSLNQINRELKLND